MISFTANGREEKNSPLAVGPTAGRESISTCSERPCNALTGRSFKRVINRTGAYSIRGNTS
jgi:hypothetical protein